MLCHVENLKSYAVVSNVLSCCEPEVLCSGFLILCHVVNLKSYALVSNVLPGCEIEVIFSGF